jgi:hypothetical protein
MPLVRGPLNLGYISRLRESTQEVQSAIMAEAKMMARQDPRRSTANPLYCTSCKIIPIHCVVLAARKTVLGGNNSSTPSEIQEEVLKQHLKTV